MKRLIDFTIKNQERIEKSSRCGCCYCEKIILEEDIKNIEYLEEEDGKNTALCPFCKIDAVLDESSIISLGYELNQDLLNKLHKISY